MRLLACDLHQDIFVEQKKLLFIDHVALAKRDEWQLVTGSSSSKTLPVSTQEGTLFFPKKKGGLKALLGSSSSSQQDSGGNLRVSILQNEG